MHAPSKDPPDLKQMMAVRKQQIRQQLIDQLPKFCQLLDNNQILCLTCNLKLFD